MVYIDSKTGGGQAVIGVTGQVKPDTPLDTNRRRRGSNILQLAKTKVELFEAQGWFTAVKIGTDCEASGFTYVTKDGYLTITNLTVASGMSLDEDTDDIYRIPIVAMQAEQAVLSNLQPLASGSS